MAKSCRNVSEGPPGWQVRRFAAVPSALVFLAILTALAAAFMNTFDDSEEEGPPGDGGNDHRPLRERRFSGICFVNIPPGEFTMDFSLLVAGMEENRQQAIALSEFWIGKYEITNDEFRRFNSDHEGEPLLPASQLKWTEASEFCKRSGFELPTEAQWEYVARSEGRSELSPLSGMGLGAFAWHSENSDLKLQPVGTKEANLWGVHDMYGNVAEWVADWFSDVPEDPGRVIKDPVGPTVGSARVFRGGCYRDSLRVLMSAERKSTRPNDANKEIGFRCAFMARNGDEGRDCDY